jgi:hypothetical protein
MRGKRLPKWPITRDHPDWPTCKCGCGTPVGAWKKGSVANGILPGQPYEYARGHTSRRAKWRDGLKECRECGEYKPPEAFNRKANGQGLTSDCKECVNTANAAWREANPEKRAAWQRAYTDANREKKAATTAQWRKDNPAWAAENGRRTRMTYRARKGEGVRGARRPAHRART